MDAPFGAEFVQGIGDGAGDAVGGLAADGLLGFEQLGDAAGAGGDDIRIRRYIWEHIEGKKMPKFVDFSLCFRHSGLILKLS